MKGGNTRLEERIIGKDKKGKRRLGAYLEGNFLWKIP